MRGYYAIRQLVQRVCNATDQLTAAIAAGVHGLAAMWLEGLIVCSLVQHGCHLLGENLGSGLSADDESNRPAWLPGFPTSAPSRRQLL
jgi:hypothetical protein